MLKIGSTVNYKKSKKITFSGVIVSLDIPAVPTNEDHGFVEVWLSSVEEYGDNNCEHFSYLGYEDFLTIIKEPIESEHFYKGQVLNTQYGKGIIVKIDNKNVSVFLCDFSNKVDTKFNKKTHCLELELSNLPKYLD